MSVHGRRIEHDLKSREYAFPRRAARIGNVRHTMNAPHVDQFYLGGCVGFSGTNMLNCAKAVRSRSKYNRAVPIGNAGYSYLGNKDGIRNYHEATIRDQWPESYPPTDTGSSALGLMKWWADISIINGYQWTFDFNGFLQALSVQPVLVGTWWYDDMMSTSSDGQIHTSLSGGRGGHEYLATEIIRDTRFIGFEQSWGENPPGFGKEGRFFMPWDVVEALIMDEGDVAVPSFL